MSATPKIFISAGEASGEHYGTLLIRALRQAWSRRPTSSAWAGGAWKPSVSGP
jgi:lipid A disaccharide synthetase